MFVYFPVENLFPVLICAWLSLNSLFILMKIVFIYRKIYVWKQFLRLGSVAFLIFYLNFMEIIRMAALELFLDSINSFKKLNYCRDAY